MISEGIREAMTDVPTWVVLLCLTAVPGLCLVLIAIVFYEQHQMRKSIDETKGLYRVMLAYVRSELGSGDDTDSP